MSPKRKRERFVKDRTQLSNDDFAARIGVRPELRGFAIAAREALGRYCRIPASQIYPEDNPEAFAKLVWDWDDLGVVLELEQLVNAWLGEPGYDFPRFLSGPATVGEWTAQVAEHVRTTMTKSTPHHSVTQKLQIVPKGYWTFWCALFVLGGIVGLLDAVLSEEKHAVAWGVFSFIWAIAWAITYWRFRHATPSA